MNILVYNFTIDETNGNICVYSDVGQGIYEYTSDGDFIKKIPVNLLFNSFSVKNEDTLFFYCGKSNNAGHFKSKFPEQYRYLAMHNNSVINQQLGYTYKESHNRIPASDDVFSFYKDTLIMTEHLTGEIYAIDDNNQLIPRYRIEFLALLIKYIFVFLQKKSYELSKMHM